MADLEFQELNCWSNLLIQIFLNFVVLSQCSSIHETEQENQIHLNA